MIPSRHGRFVRWARARPGSRPTPAHPVLGQLVLLTLLLAQAVPAAGATVPAPSVELVLPADALLTGYLGFEARVRGAVDRVGFQLDGRPLLSRRTPPYRVEVDLGPLPAFHTLRAIAYGADGRELARDQRFLNRPPHRFAIHLVASRPASGALDQARVQVRAEVPIDHTLARVELYRGEQHLVTLPAPPDAYPIPLDGPHTPVVVRVRGLLDDGREAEDAVVINGPQAAEIVHVDLVEVYATVLDRRGRPVAGLTAGDFTVRENGEPQPLRRFEPVHDLPLHATILLDTSASMAPRLAAARRAAVRFFDQTVQSRDDAVALIAFSDRPRVIAPYTADHERFSKGLEGLRAAHSTALYDSLVYGLYYQGGLEGHRALLLISDGDDEISRNSLELALDYARHAQVTVYSVGLALEGQGSKRILARLADETGGRSFSVAQPEDLDAIYQTVLNELRARYLLVYQSPGVGRGFRNVEVAVAGRGLRVRAMRGYTP